MFISEVILDEDTAETKDLMAIAYYVAQWMNSPEVKQWDGIELTLDKIQKYSGMQIPDIQSETVQKMLTYPLKKQYTLAFVPNSVHLQKAELGVFFPEEWEIGINLELHKKRGKNIASTILHELQHALDSYKSSGEVFKSAYNVDPNVDFNAYMMHPSEINARFSQALWDLASNFETVTRSDVYSSIESMLKKNQLDSTFVKDTKQHKRLVVRAYKFLADVSQIINNPQAPPPGTAPMAPRVAKTQPQNLTQKIKNLIRKWLLPSNI